MPLNEGCNALKNIEVAKLYKQVADRFISDNPRDFCNEGIKMIYAPVRFNQNHTSVRIEIQRKCST